MSSLFEKNKSMSSTKKQTRLVAAIVIAALLSACASSGNGPQANEGENTSNAQTGQTAVEAIVSEDPAQEAGSLSGADAEDDVNLLYGWQDPNIVYKTEPERIAENERYAFEVSSYEADEDGLNIRFQIQNKTDSQYLFTLSSITVNGCGISMRSEDSMPEAGKSEEGVIRIPAYKMRQYSITSPGEVRFLLNGYDFPEFKNDIVHNELTIHPTLEEGAAMDPVSVVDMSTYDMILDQDEISFGIKKEQLDNEEQNVADNGSLKYYAENKSDQMLVLRFNEIEVDNYELNVDYGYSIESPVYEMNLLPHSKWMSKMLPAAVLQENNIEVFSSLKMKLSVLETDTSNPDESESIAEKVIEYDFDIPVIVHVPDQENGASASGKDTSGADQDEKPLDEILVDNEKYQAKATGYSMTEKGASITVELKNKADSIFTFNIGSDSGYSVNHELFPERYGDFMGFGDLEPGETTRVSVRVPAEVLETYDIKEIEEVTFAISGNTKAGEEEFGVVLERTWASVHPSGSTHEELFDSLEVREEDCCAFVEGEGFTAGMLKETHPGDPRGTLCLYMENTTDEEIYAVLNEISINGTRYVETTNSGNERDITISMELAPRSKYLVRIFKPEELAELEIDDISELDFGLLVMQGSINDAPLYNSHVHCEFP